VSRNQKGKTNLDFTKARDSEWQWHQLGHMQVCVSLQTDNHASTPPLSFLQAGCPSCRPTNSVKALKGLQQHKMNTKKLKPGLVALYTTSGLEMEWAYSHRSRKVKNTHPFNGLFSGTTWVSRYQKGKTSLDFTEARDSE